MTPTAEQIATLSARGYAYDPVQNELFAGSRKLRVVLAWRTDFHAWVGYVGLDSRLPIQTMPNEDLLVVADAVEAWLREAILGLNLPFLTVKS